MGGPVMYVAPLYATGAQGQFVGNMPAQQFGYAPMGQQVVYMQQPPQQEGDKRPHADQLSSVTSV